MQNYPRRCMGSTAAATRLHKTLDAAPRRRNSRGYPDEERGPGGQHKEAAVVRRVCPSACVGVVLAEWGMAAAEPCISPLSELAQAPAQGGKFGPINPLCPVHDHAGRVDFAARLGVYDSALGQLPSPVRPAAAPAATAAPPTALDAGARPQPGARRRCAAMMRPPGVRSRRLSCISSSARSRRARTAPQ